MVKSFSEFVNENYDIQPSVVTLDMTPKFEELVLGDVYFNTLMESSMNCIEQNINEGNINYIDESDAMLLTEGLFDLFKKGAEKVAAKADANANDAAEDYESTHKYIENWLQNHKDFDDIDLGDFKEQLKEEKDRKKFADLCKKCSDKAVEILTSIAEKEDKTLDLAKQTLEDFGKFAIDLITNAMKDIKDITIVLVGLILSFAATVAKFVKEKALPALKDITKKVVKGTVILISIPFLLLFELIKVVIGVCEKLFEKAKKAYASVKEILSQLQDSICSWISDKIAEIKDEFVSIVKKAKEVGKDIVNNIAETSALFIGLCGMLASNIGESVKEYAENIKKSIGEFVDSASEFADEIKAKIYAKWIGVKSWTKKTSGEFVKGVSNTWKAFKGNLAKLRDDAKSKLDDLNDKFNTMADNVKNWSDEKKKQAAKKAIEFAEELVGEDVVLELVRA